MAHFWEPEIIARADELIRRISDLSIMGRRDLPEPVQTGTGSDAHGFRSGAARDLNFLTPTAQD
ncbi:hypothetical protein PSP6_160003 [Paraburkholderia tropica]|nr:hypothetical protein PSP6_160003 [Paraburkholderia tropica]